jgi:hypothetical protein
MPPGAPMIAASGQAVLPSEEIAEIGFRNQQTVDADAAFPRVSPGERA